MTKRHDPQAAPARGPWRSSLGRKPHATLALPGSRPFPAARGGGIAAGSRPGAGHATGRGRHGRGRGGRDPGPDRAHAQEGGGHEQGRCRARQGPAVPRKAGRRSDQGHRHHHPDHRGPAGEDDRPQQRARGHRPGTRRAFERGERARAALDGARAAGGRPHRHARSRPARPLQARRQSRGSQNPARHDASGTRHPRRQAGGGGTRTGDPRGTAGGSGTAPCRARAGRAPA